MKILRNDKGIALVTSLMFTVLALVITMSLLYMVTAGTRSSGAMKRYRTTTEAAYGGSDIVLKDLISATFGFADYSANRGPLKFKPYMQGYMGGLSSPFVDSCLQIRLKYPKREWISKGCSDDVLTNIASSHDISFKLNAATGQPFTVYSRIVDNMGYKLSVFENFSSKTLTIAGNSDTSQYQLEGTAVTEAAGAFAPHYPYMYRVEVQTVRDNSEEKTKLTVQYAY